MLGVQSDAWTNCWRATIVEALLHLCFYKVTFYICTKRLWINVNAFRGAF